MSTLSRRRIRLLASLLAAIGLLVAGWYLLPVFLPLVFSALIANLLRPLAVLGDRSPLGRRWPQANKAIVAGMLTMLALLILLAVGAVAVWGAVDGVHTLSVRIPKVLEESSETWERLEKIYREQVPPGVQEAIQPQLERMQGAIVNAGFNAVERVAKVAQSGISQLITLAALPVVVFDMVRRRSAVDERSWRLVPKPLRDDLTAMTQIVGEVIMAYVRAQLLLAIMVGVVIAVTYWALDIPLALPLAFLSVVTELLPVIGSTVFILLTGILLLLTDPGKLPLALGIFVVVQVVQNSLVVPRLHSRALGLPPMALVFSLAIFGLFFGLLGALIAAPITGATVQVFQYVGKEWSGVPEPVENHTAD